MVSTREHAKFLRGAVVTDLSRDANRKVDGVCEASAAARLTQHKMAAYALPPNASCNNRVSFASR